MDYNQTALTILELVGGEGNVNGLTHCATRLRFNLKDNSKAKTSEIKSLAGVIGVAEGAGQFQVIIGNDVPKYYKPISDVIGSNTEKNVSGKNKGIGSRFIEMISSIFTPILPAITAAGMLKAVLSLVVVLKWVDNTSTTYNIINFMADAGFYFLPILLANSAAKRFNANAYLAMMIAGVMLHPSFVAMVANSKETGEAIKFLFLPVYNASYASSVLPIILTVWFMSWVERFAQKYSPSLIRYFMVPLITVLVAGGAALVVFGPIGYIISNYIAEGVIFLEETMGWFLPALLGAFFPLLVMTGTHYGLVPIGANNIMTMGYDSIIGPGNLASNIAQGGAALAVGLKSKNSDEKQQAITAGITATCGITEPALFGVNIKYKTPLYSAMIGGGIGGLIIGIFKVRRFATGSPGLMTLPVYIGDQGFTNFFYACLGSLVAFVVAFIISYITFKPNQEGSNEEVKTEEKALLQEEIVTIAAPVNGNLIDLNKVNDQAFAGGSVGKGVAIVPTDGNFVSPVKGEVVMVFKTNHAIGIKSEDNAEILIHVGLDTVQLEGEFFEPLVKQGDKVDVGTPILKVNLEGIKSKGYDITTPILITNTFEFSDILSAAEGNVVVGKSIIKGIK